MTAPANDDFTNAIALTAGGGTLAVPTNDATSETGESALGAGGATQSVWFTWTPAAGPARVRVPTQNEGYVYRVVSAYTGSSIGALTPVQGGTDEFANHKAEWIADGTTTYRIRVAAFNNGTDGGTMVYGPYTKPANDDIADAIDLDEAGGSLGYDNTLAGVQPGERPRGNGYSLWYKITPTSDTAMAFDVSSSPSAGTSYPSMLLYDAADLSLPAAPGYDVDPVGDGASRLVTALLNGHTYYLRIEANNPHDDNILLWGPVTPPANDAFDDATALDPPSGGSVAFDNSNATRDAVDDEWDWTGNGTLWFSYTTPVPGPVTFHTEATPVGDGADTYLAVWAGATLVPTNDDPPTADDDDSGPDYAAHVTFDAEADVPYLIQLSAYDVIPEGVLTWLGPAPPRPMPARQPAHPMVWTAAPNAGSTDRVYLDQLGAVTGLRHAGQYPGGCKDLSCKLAIPPELAHRALTPGRDVGVTVGAEDVWLGTLNAPTVDSDGARLITADGDAAATKGLVALGLATHNALNANEVIDAATLSGRHSRFRRVDTLPVPDGQRADDAAFMMDEALTQAANAAGKRWRIDLDRVIRFYPYEGDGRRYVLHARQDIGRTLDGQVTRLDAAFIDAETGLYRVEHVDAPAAATGSTFYPAFYTPDGSAYAAGGFTLYTDGSTITAYVIGKPAAAGVLSLSSPAVDLSLVEESQFYSRFTGAGVLAPGATGRTGTYRGVIGGPAIDTGAQEGPAHRGHGSLQATGNIPPKEAVVDLTSQGAFTQAQALEQLTQHLGRSRSAPHYDGSWTASYGDLTTTGGVPVDLASVQAGCQLIVLAVDPTRNLADQADDVLVTIGEVEYDADTQTLRLIPDASPDRPEPEPTVDFATGLIR